MRKEIGGIIFPLKIRQQILRSIETPSPLPPKKGIPHPRSPIPDPDFPVHETPMTCICANKQTTTTTRKEVRKCVHNLVQVVSIKFLDT